MSKKYHSTKKISNSEYISLCKKSHDINYSYLKTVYINDASNVIVTCPMHGDFTINAGRFKRGCNCQKCSGRGLTKEDLIKVFTSVHNGKYDYSKMVLNKMNDKVEIICPIHGSFFQSPTKHKKGQGCPKCAKQLIADKRRKTTEEWIDDAQKVHGDKYDYSKVKYVNPFEPIIIICPKHGEFKQIPNDHLNRHGCPKCKSSHLEEEIRLFLTENNIVFEEQKRFDWLGKQSLDFYIPSKKIAIECQGEQHFKPIKHFGGNIAFKIQQERDKRKKMLCEKHNIKIIYYSKEKNIDKKLVNM